MHKPNLQCAYFFGSTHAITKQNKNKTYPSISNNIVNVQMDQFRKKQSKTKNNQIKLS